MHLLPLMQAQKSSETHHQRDRLSAAKGALHFSPPNAIAMNAPASRFDLLADV
jgi:hypothetical protein